MAEFKMKNHRNSQGFKATYCYFDQNCEHYFASVAALARFECSTSSISAGCIRSIAFAFLTLAVGFDCSFCSSFFQNHLQVADWNWIDLLNY
jgi:hypothetical protein